MLWISQLAHALHMVVESFQGQYKDGSNGTWDFRMVSASFLILDINYGHICKLALFISYFIRTAMSFICK